MGLMILGVAPETVGLLPEADVVIVLSVWHHFVRTNGLDDATMLMGRIWARTRCVLFFDTGESEMPASYNLPEMSPDSRTWLGRYLAGVCTNGEVRHLGVHAAFDADGEPALRNLFAIVRQR
jgi:hypothetical protein